MKFRNKIASQQPTHGGVLAVTDKKDSILERAENVRLEFRVFFTPDEVARIARITPQTVNIHIRDSREGKWGLKASKIGRNWRILESDLREYLGVGPDVPIVIPIAPPDVDDSDDAVTASDAP